MNGIEKRSPHRKISPPERFFRIIGNQLRTSPATYSLIGLTSLIFLIQLVMGQIQGCDTLVIYGAKNRTAVASGELWRLITPLFLHLSFTHMFFNMFSLFAIGLALERFMGSSRLLAIYLLSGISGVMVSLVFCPLECVGASGSIFGLLGSLVIFMLIHRNVQPREGGLQILILGIVILLNLGLVMAPNIDPWGHLGGLIAGVVLTWVFGPRFKLVQVSTTRMQWVDTRPMSVVRASMLLSAAIIIAATLLVVLIPISC